MPGTKRPARKRSFKSKTRFLTSIPEIVHPGDLSKAELAKRFEGVAWVIAYVTGLTDADPPAPLEPISHPRMPGGNKVSKRDESRSMPGAPPAPLSAHMLGKWRVLITTPDDGVRESLESILHAYGGFFEKHVRDMILNGIADGAGTVSSGSEFPAKFDDGIAAFFGIVADRYDRFPRGWNVRCLISAYDVRPDSDPAENAGQALMEVNFIVQEDRNSYSIQ